MKLTSKREMNDPGSVRKLLSGVPEKFTWKLPTAILVNLPRKPLVGHCALGAREKALKLEEMYCSLAAFL